MRLSKEEILLTETDIKKENENTMPSSSEKIVIETKNLNFYYNADAIALKNVNITIPDKKVTAFIGPSGCGKSTLLRCFNRMNDLIIDTFHEGDILINGQTINAEFFAS